ncbi:Peroxisomal membrane protein PMP47B [Cladophialophora carrionii]|uniref:Peroxisomal membrane protein PMP47B n=1 Tax=Cladophialophora carrionii TaxID=86049 RepID=A0A1C1CVU6_9EURO|nr:Peroxisomal membrane protein PMP47B [Cladophialophora carrionii]
MSDTKNVAPTPTEGDLDQQTSQTAGTVNTVPSRDPTPATSAAQQSDNIAHALAGAGGGLLAMTLTYPLITLSTRAQVESKRADTSTLAAVRHIINREGLGGLYAGLDSALFGISVTNFVYYYWYEWTRAFFEKAAITAGRASKKLTTVESMIAGAIAGSATVLLTNPIWVVNTRMTARKSDSTEDQLPGGEKRPSKKQSTIGTFLSLLRDEGPSSLFAGVLPALVLVINPILQYTIYEQFRNVIEKRRKVGPKDAFYLGAIGKLLATTITYPYITVKSRAHVATKNDPHEGMWKSLNKIVKDEGYSGLYKGIVPKVSQSVLTAAFLFAFKDVLYEWTVAARRKAKAIKA